MTDQVPQNDLLVEDEQEDESVAITYDISSYPSDFTLSGIARMWEDGDIIIPDYQREFVWTMQQSSLLIDSFLCGLPVPPVFFYVDEESKNLVIDGQQRILSVVFFLDGYFGKKSETGKRKPFRLSGLNKRSPYYNMAFHDLGEADQRKLKQAVLRAVNIRQLNPAGENTSAYHIFERLNTGGTPLKQQEIRNCVFRGRLNNLLKEANMNENWRKILGKNAPDKHQKDIELLLRVFALTGASSDYEKPMKEFLNRAMKVNITGGSSKTIDFFASFDKVMESVVASLGVKPFHLRGPLNVSALDSVLSVLIEYYEKIDFTNLSTNYSELLKDVYFDEYTSINTTDTHTVKKRISRVKEYLIS